ncbi:unnamed protein product [Pedinophyceae sp. YPF-701]|nr:unnamed protein product [Pedinophyceae sp. YPF-701]
MLLLGNLSTAFSDVVVDSLVVERARGEPQRTAGSLQSLCWGSRAVGGIASAYASGSLVETLGNRPVFALTAAFPLMVSFSAWLIDEAPAASAPSRAAAVAAGTRKAGADLAGLLKRAGAQGSVLFDAVRDRGILLPALFVFFWQATPTAGEALFYFYTNQLGFAPEFLGRVRLVSSCAELAGAGLYNRYLKDIPLRKIFLWTALSGTVLSATQLLLVTGLNRELGIDDRFFVLGDSVILTLLGQISFLPVLVLAARICPPGVEATLFATLMSLLNAGAFASGLLGSGLTAYLGVTAKNFDNLAILVGICCASQLLPLPLLKLVPNENQQSRIDDAKKDDSSSA